VRLLPPQPLLGDIVRTSLVVWVGLHFAFASAIVWGAEGGSPLALSPVVAAPLLVLVVVIAHLDRTSRGLSLFLANLGFSSRAVGLVVLGVAGAAEVALQTLVRLVL